MKFTKYNNPSKRRKKNRKVNHSQQYINERKEELYKLLAEAKTDQEKKMLIDAYRITIDP